MFKILEISNSTSKNGRRPIKIALHKIHSDVREVNRNGIHWSKINTENNISSVNGIPICAEFNDDEKRVPLGHGYTSTERIEGKDTPLFENSVVVGTIQNGSIEDIEVDGETITALCGIGYLYDQRYPNFVQWVKENLVLSQVDTSIEIMGKEENDNRIIYEGDECTEEYRIPQIYDYSGVCVLSVLPADSSAIVLECASANISQKEENNQMTEKEIMEIVAKAINETNSAKENVETTISELNTQIVEKDTKITELNASIEEMQTLLKQMQSDRDTYWEQVEILQKEIAKAQIASKLGEIDSTIGEFNESDVAFVKDDIEKLKANINACEKKEELEGFTSEINSIRNKICVGIVERQRAEAKVIAEQNAAKEHVNDAELDIFSEINSDESEAEDDNIF
jgi:uncharacterized coiled-coil protein SlyX